MMKFKVSPSVRAAAVPTGTGFGAYAGLKRYCVKFKFMGGKLRCAKFKAGRGKPKCDRRLVDGGRSPHLVRNGPCYTIRGKGAYARRRAR